MKFTTIRWNEADRTCTLLDQTRLPGEVVYETYRDYREMETAIKTLKVRGAPAIGVAAAFGVVLGVQDSRAGSYAAFKEELNTVVAVLAATRPTAVNLFWALERMRRVADENAANGIEAVKTVLTREALAIRAEDEAMCRHIGIHGAVLIETGQTVLTHCNAGALATAGTGTALSVIYQAHREGKNIRVFADETRPVLQGARLTAWELVQEGIDVTLICDNMAAQVMKEGKIDCVVVGADRIAANGDVANKIGTYGVAVLARAHDIPVYVAAPSTTIDMTIRTGVSIPIEERHASEVTEGLGRRTAPDGVRVYNPAFDVTPAAYVSAIVTERGVARFPYDKSLAALMSG
ncbi:MAG: S-methyl-5-thioribose-1-phosphate isomerase [candidate division Zixibacteria bacterium]|nr:S-methyl-5-thioribose-1-phosphate isomerase [candidate division Zixibacteria bacterium]